MNGWETNALAWAAQGEKSPSFFPPEMIFMFVIIFALFYFLILRPQRTEKRKRDQMLDELGKGDSVVTAGGLHGTVESLDKEKGIVTLNVAPKIHMRFNRSSVSTIVQKKSKPNAEKKTK